MSNGLEKAFQDALAFHQHGQFAMAEEAYLSILEQDPEFALANQNMVDLLLRKGQPHLALPYAIKATELLPDSAQSHFNLAVVWLNQGDIVQAIPFMEKAAEMDPASSEAQYQLGNLYYSNGQIDQAKTAYTNATQMQPDLVAAWLNLGNLVSESGDYDTALALLRKAEELHPDYGHTLKCIGGVLHALNRTNEALTYYQRAYPTLGEDVELLTLIGHALRDQGRYPEAIEWYRKALLVNPKHNSALLNLSQLEGARIHAWHLEMLADTARNEAYEKAITNAITPETTVLDIGTGSGLLSLMAARAGAKQVVACEIVETLAETAKEIVRINGYQDRINVIHKKSSELQLGKDMPERANLIVSEILDVGLLGEGVLPSLRHAKGSLAHPLARLIPQKAEIRGILIESPQQRQINPLKTLCGFDLSPFDQYRPKGKYRHLHLVSIPYRQLSEEFLALNMDFANLPPVATEEKPNRSTIQVTCQKDGLLQGVAFWFRLWLDENTSLSTGPKGEMIHWGQALYLFEEDLPVKAGEIIPIHVLQSELLVKFEI